MTDQTTQGGLYGLQGAPDDSTDAGAATEAGDGRVAGRDELERLRAQQAGFFAQMAAAREQCRRWWRRAQKAEQTVERVEAENERLRTTLREVLNTFSRATVAGRTAGYLAEHPIAPDMFDQWRTVLERQQQRERP